MAEWDDCDDPVDIEDAVNNFLPKEEPKRSEAIVMLAQMMQIDMKSLHDEDAQIGALVSAATLRVVRSVSVSRVSRRSSVGDRGLGGRKSVSGGAVTVDDTLDMIKLVIVGDSGVGKTCLMLRFVKDEFVTSTRATIGMDFCTRQLTVDLLSASESSVVQRLTVQVWDTAGQEQFHSLTATYYRKAGGVMIVYDSHVRATFESLGRWIAQVDENAEDVVKMIIAAKSEGDVAVSEEEGRAFAEAHDCLFFATSSKIGDGVLPAFKMLSAHVLAAQESKEERRDEILLGMPAPEKRPKKAGCC